MISANMVFVDVVLPTNPTVMLLAIHDFMI